MTFDPYVDRIPLADPKAFFVPSSASSPSVKPERSSSPHIDHTPSPLHNSFSFSCPFPPVASPDNLGQPALSYAPVSQDRPVFRFGMPHNGHNHTSHSADSWSLKRTQHDTAHGETIALDLNTHSFADDYEDGDELSDLPGSAATGQASHTSQSDRIVRRRSSKACDQCRKSKCKCERTADGDTCKSCIMLGTPCTFLGPSRKRGPPKGYIDAIEARLHQTEALLGVLLAVEADRTEGSDNSGAHGKSRLDTLEKEESLEGVLAILRKDTLAREILNRVNSSPYGVKGRQNGGVKVRPHAQAQENSGGGIDIQTTHPSNEWQDRVTALLASSLKSRPSHPSASSTTATSDGLSLSDVQLPRPLHSQRSSIHLSHLSDGDHVRRQRRRVDGDERDDRSPSPNSITLRRTRSTSPGFSPARNIGYTSGGGYASGYMGATDSDSEDEVADAVGQLSLNEDEVVRYHGKASGLYLLGINAKEEARNEGGIWRFPKARVWPPLPPPTNTPVLPPMAMGFLSGSPSTKSPTNASAGHLPLTSAALDSDVTQLPDLTMQEHLLELYFTYVHPGFPILHKDLFWEGYRSMQNPPTDTPSPPSDLGQGGAGSPSTPIQRKRRHVSPLLLLCMFSIAARYSPSSAPLPSARSHPSEPMPMWTAGDNFLLAAKNLLDNTYASSLPSTVQSLLLLGYREIGIGAMAQAWAYTGMAVRMAQDLGMHRAADGWARVGMGRLFGERELQERRRIWWGCVLLDGYVSSYIGRPLAIFERDYDTQLPAIDEQSEEQETWTEHPSLPPDTRGHGYRPSAERMPPVPGRILSGFSASATLSTILSKIVQSIYAIRTNSSRHSESNYLEGLLDKWYLDLADHLRFELRYDAVGNLSAAGGRGMPPPHILTLQMQYWCTTLLLHRPFIRQIHLVNKPKSENGDEADVRAASKKNYELCVGAANHIASIVSFYRERYCLQRAPVFLCFYVFTAGIMHVTSLSVNVNDPQAQVGLAKCMDALRDMEAVWPSAARALELLSGCDPLNKNASSKRVRIGQLVTRQTGMGQERNKRAAEDAADSEDVYGRSQMHVPVSSSSGGGGGSGSLTLLQPYAQAWRSTQFTSVSPATGPGAVGQPPGGDFLPPPTSTTSSSASSYYPWPSPADVVGSSSYDPFPGTLSTSVLPQMYSTGLIDERRVHHTLTSSQHPRVSGPGQGSGPGHGHGHGHSHLHSTGAGAGGGISVGQGGGYESASGGRYPQYWSDYTSFPQMGIGMGTYGSSEDVVPGQGGPEGMYMNGHYGGIYGHPTQP